MRYLVVPFSLVIFSAIAFSSCSYPDNGRTKIYLYRRSIGSNNGHFGYMDELAIPNYKNKSISIDSFVRMAKMYVDTISSDTPVTNVAFLGQPAEHGLPPVGNNFIGEQRKYFLVDIGFDESHPERKELTSIAIWISGQREPFADYSSKLPSQKRPFDSTIKSKEPLDKGL